MLFMRNRNIKVIALGRISTDTPDLPAEPRIPLFWARGVAGQVAESDAVEGDFPSTASRIALT
jgi:hypothetical protein